MSWTRYAAAAGAGFFVVSANTALAGGIERGSNNYGLLFEEGDRIETGVTLVYPDVSGTYRDALGGGGTGDIVADYSVLSASYKNAFSDQLDFAIFLNQPYGANSTYDMGAYAGLSAEWESDEVTAILKYNITDRISVFGGARYVRSKADITIPELLIRGAVGNNAEALGAEAQTLGAQAQAAAAAGDLATAAALGAQAQALGAEAQRLGALVDPATNPLGDAGLNFAAGGDTQGDFGYVLGAAYEIPDIAFRASLTYQSEIVHAFDAPETLPTFAIGGVLDDTEVTMPQSLALDIQSGVAPGTLVFGGVKWTEWSAWEVRTPGYDAITNSEIVGFDNDVYTWKLGVGRQFNEKMSGFAQLTYEKANGGEVSRLSPTDGSFAIGLGGQWSDENAKLRAGLQYVALGDAEDSSGTEYEDNSALGVGITFTVSF